MGEHREEVRCVWVKGLTGQSLESCDSSDTQTLSGSKSKLEYARGNGVRFSDYYELHEILGAGAFGMCKAGVHKPSSTPCAVKFCRKKIAGDAYVKNFVTDDVFSCLLDLTKDDHPSIVKYLDFMMGPQFIIEVMEILHGQELFDHIVAHAPITENWCRAAMEQGLSALQTTHKHGLLHRDVKPESFRFRTDCVEFPDAQLVLFDYGLSCLESCDNKGFAGTPGYMAPEVTSMKYDTQIDLWSMGGVLYTMLAGHLPFQASAAKPVMNAVDLKNAMTSRGITGGPEGAVDLLKKLMVMQPKDRLTAGAALKHSWFSAAKPLKVEDKDSSAAPAPVIIDVPRATYAMSVQQSRALATTVMDGTLRERGASVDVKDDAAVASGIDAIPEENDSPSNSKNMPAASGMDAIVEEDDSPAIRKKTSMEDQIQLFVGMGFDAEVAKKALDAAGGDVAVAVQALFSDKGGSKAGSEGTPKGGSKGGSGGYGPPPVAPEPPAPAKEADDGMAEAVQQLQAMGFDEKAAKDALKKAGGDVEVAAGLLLDGLGKMDRQRNDLSEFASAES